MEDRQIRLEPKLVGEVAGASCAPSCQRGHRWGTDEVRRLLDDVSSNGERNYCLQPVVVRKSGATYELIDGQQRLTTLYLIYRYMGSASPHLGDPAFCLTCQTHESSEEFLRTVDLSRREENIDFWFIANAYETIARWFEADPQTRIGQMRRRLRENVKVIWYEVGESEGAISLFTRLNIGKIPLTNRATARYQTRIDLVLNLISQKPEGDREKYYTFFKLDELGKSTSLAELWERIQQTFLTLKDWHQNHELYHKVGYLIASERTTLQNVFTLSVDKTKGEFRALLDEKIQESIAIKRNYAELSYENANDRKRLYRLLLLFNVESVRQNGEHTQWFPFDKLKYTQRGRVSWSLEHIHAQQSETLRTQDAVRTSGRAASLHIGGHAAPRGRRVEKVGQ